MERLTDPAQGYCEMYCKKYGHCFGDPGDCIFEKEIAMYDALKSIEGIVPFDRLLELALADKEERLVVLHRKYRGRDGERALRKASLAVNVTNNGVNRYTVDAIAEKLAREEAETALAGERKDGEG